MLGRGRDVQLGIGISLLGGVEGDSEEVSSKGLVEDTVAPLTAIVDGLVDDIPGVTVTLVVLNNVGDVRLDNLGEFRLGELSSRNCLLVRTYHFEQVMKQTHPSWEAGCAKSKHGIEESACSSWQDQEQHRPLCR